MTIHIISKEGQPIPAGAVPHIDVIVAKGEVVINNAGLTDPITVNSYGPGGRIGSRDGNLRVEPEETKRFRTKMHGTEDTVFVEYIVEGS